MNILLISQCNKRALTETRRILDQFAERRGDRTWQTPITLQGLKTLHKMLRKTARKNTAVACHWIRGKDHSELMWVVGDAKRFNAQGATPTNTTTRNVLRSQDENDWHTAEDIRLLASMAALFHDLGKANDAFQKKLTNRGNKPIADPYRHEWVSLRLFEAFVDGRCDDDWLRSLLDLRPNEKQDWLDNILKDGIDRRTPSPFKTFQKQSPLAQVIGWLIVSHHRIPATDEDLAWEELDRLPFNISAAWCGSREADAKNIKSCWSFKKGLPFASKHWCQHINKLAKKIIQRPQLQDKEGFENPYVIHVARLALMLADHYYSAEKSHARYGDAEFPLIANTLREENGAPNQRLDEHLIGVEVSASRIMQALPRMASQLPKIARHKGFRQRSKLSRFRWQDKAYDLAVGLQEKSSHQGFFGINMASTGCGKTLANGRIMYGLSNPQQGARFNIALGLRSLTLQTGDVYRERLGLGDEDLAVLVGGGAVRELHKKQTEESEQSKAGAESSEALLPENHYVHYEGSLEDGPLNRWLGKNSDAKKLLNAPILTCTIDHLMPATEGIRGGRQIAPMLRLMSSDLILDEPDDFGLDDLPALTRLVHWAAMLGSRVLLSSATLPPALLQGLFQAYVAGRTIYQKNRGIPGLPVNVCCAWFDEFNAQSSDNATAENFSQAHQQFIEKRLQKLSDLAQKEQRRKAEIKPIEIAAGQNRDDICSALASIIHQQAHQLHHAHHSEDLVSGKKLSFGLIRMANINPLIRVAQALHQLGGNEDCYVHLCVYHSQHPLLVRSAIEKKLDRWLNRKEEDAIFRDNELRQILNTHPENNHLFIVLATPVAEVGRDHDYDWAIVEPSSMRSIIQLAGRVRRHRNGNVNTANIYLLDNNVRHLEQGINKPAFCRPGFESKSLILESHQLSELLTPEQWAVIDASSRISERDQLQPQQNLVDLEHVCLHDLILGAKEGDQQIHIPAIWWWQTRAHLSGHLQNKQRFRNDPQGRQRYALLLDEDGQPEFCQIMLDGVVNPVSNLINEIEIIKGERVGFWGAVDYMESLAELADLFDSDPSQCARRFGFIDLPRDESGKVWNYHSALGFFR